MKPLKHMLFIVLTAAALTMLPAFMAQAQQLGNNEPTHYVTLTITNTGLSSSVDQPVGGLYVLTVRNNSANARGLVMRGIDYCCSPYTRLVKILRPGQQLTFRWYFPTERTVEIRDLVRCDPSPTACYPWVPGEKSLILQFP